MPSRIIREEYLTSEAVDSLPADAECFFVRLMLKADDHGRFSANPKLLKSALYPLKDDVRDTDIARKLAAAEQAGVVRCYEVDNKRYLEIPKFRQRTRSVSKYPDPPPDKSPPLDGQMPVKCQANDGLCVVGCVVVVEGEKGVGRSSADPTREAPKLPAATAAPRPDSASAGGLTAGNPSPKPEGRGPKPPKLEAVGDTNKPTLESALAWFEWASRTTDERLASEEIREAYRTFEASQDKFGNWTWGKRSVGDWRAAMTQRVLDNREKRGGKKPVASAADVLTRAINRVRVNDGHVTND